MKKESKPRLFIAITSPISILLIRGQLNYFNSNGYDVSLIAPNDKSVIDFAKSEGVTHLPVNFKREIALLSDIITLIKLVFLLFKHKPDIVNAGTPKASLLTLLAAKLVGIKYNIYTCRGLRYESEEGSKRHLLKLIEKVIGILANKVICVGNGLKKVAIEDGLFKEKKCVVIANGSSNGINLNHFKRTSEIESEGLNLKKELFLKDNYLIVGFVGRMIIRKGIEELVLSYNELTNKYPKTYLLIVGGFDEAQQPNAEVQKIIKNSSHIIVIDWVQDVRPYFSLFDIFVLPSYWEGLANVLLQAAAMQLPIITTTGTGCYDAVKEGFNADVVQKKSTQELKLAMDNMIANPIKRAKYAENSIMWVKEFDSILIWRGLANLYSQMLNKKMRSV